MLKILTSLNSQFQTIAFSQQLESSRFMKCSPKRRTDSLPSILRSHASMLSTTLSLQNGRNTYHAWRGYRPWSPRRNRFQMRFLPKSFSSPLPKPLWLSRYPWTLRRLTFGYWPTFAPGGALWLWMEVVSGLASGSQTSALIRNSCQQPRRFYGGVAVRWWISLGYRGSRARFPEAIPFHSVSPSQSHQSLGASCFCIVYYRLSILATCVDCLGRVRGQSQW